MCYVERHIITWAPASAIGTLVGAIGARKLFRGSGQTFGMPDEPLN
jgi:hypothetical protein